MHSRAFVRLCLSRCSPRSLLPVSISPWARLLLVSFDSLLLGSIPFTTHRLRLNLTRISRTLLTSILSPTAHPASTYRSSFPISPPPCLALAAPFASACSSSIAAPYRTWRSRAWRFTRSWRWSGRAFAYDWVWWVGFVCWSGADAQ